MSHTCRHNPEATQARSARVSACFCSTASRYAKPGGEGRETSGQAAGAGIGGRQANAAGLRRFCLIKPRSMRVARRLRKNWTVHRYRDYVGNPKESGYRALHLIVAKRGVKIELQLRTGSQDFWANQIESDSRLLRTDFKSGKGSDAAYYVAMSEFFAIREASEDPPEEFMFDLARRYVLARQNHHGRSDDGR